MTHTPPAIPDAADGEREVDLARVARSLLARWWLVAGAVAIGVAVGYLVARGSESLFQAQATIYLGQPLSAAGASQVQNIQRSTPTVTQIVKAPALTAQVAADVGIDADQLREGISTQVVRRPGAAAGEGDLMEVIVRGPWRGGTEDAADRLADAVVVQLSTYADSKIVDLDSQLQAEQAELTTVEAQITELEASLASVEDEAERLRLETLLGLREEQRSELIEDRVTTELGLAVARDIERGQVVTAAAARKVDARDRSTSMIVGGVIGLIVGLIAALAWSPLIARLRATRAGARTPG